MGTMSFCTKCKRPTHMALLDGKPAHPHEADFSLLECKDCYGEVEWFDGDAKLVLRWQPSCSVGSDLYEMAVQMTEDYRNGVTQA